MKLFALAGLALLLLVGCDRSPTVPAAPEVLASRSAHGGPPFREVAAGDGFSCALNARGDAFCWGRNTFGMLGAGDTEGSTTPRTVLADAGFSAIQAAGFHACALGRDGTVFCWGRNDVGEAGVSRGDRCVLPTGVEIDCVLQPAAVAGDLRFHSIDAGWGHNCGLTAQGEAYCWGWNEFGQLGTTTSETCLQNGVRTVPCSRAPVPVDGGLKFTSISAGFWQTCGVTADDQTYCWGRNTLGTFGNGSTGAGGATPVPGGSGVVFRSLSSGSGAACAITPDRIAMCWGAFNAAGELGDGTNTPHLIPQPIAGDFLNLDAVNTAGENNVLGHVCGIARTGDARCWGSNRAGQLGVATTQICTFANIVFGCSNVPLAVSGGYQFEVIAAGNEHTCGATKGGEVLCWGRNTTGQVGDGTTINRPEPVPVALP